MGFTRFYHKIRLKPPLGFSGILHEIHRIIFGFYTLWSSSNSLGNSSLTLTSVTPPLTLLESLLNFIGSLGLLNSCRDFKLFFGHGEHYENKMLGGASPIKSVMSRSITSGTSIRNVCNLSHVGFESLLWTSEVPVENVSNYKRCFLAVFSSFVVNVLIGALVCTFSHLFNRPFVHTAIRLFGS